MARHALFQDREVSDREKKNLTILELIRKDGPIARTEISRRTGFNIVTVSNYMNNYLKAGLVVEKGLDVSTGGRKPVLIELNTKYGYVVGVDLGPDHIGALLTDFAIGAISRVRKPRTPGPIEEAITKAVDLIREAITKAKIDAKKIKGIGIGISGVIDAQAGTVRDTDPARGQTTGRLSILWQQIEHEFGIPAYIGNDATCAAFGEKNIGIESDVKNLLYVYSDVGCGMIIKGDIYCGAGGSAGEMQLMLEGGQLGATNFLRPWGVDLGIVNSMKRVVSEGATSRAVQLAGGHPDKITLADVIQAATEGDDVARQIIEDAGQNLGMRIAYLINLFNPEVAVIGGGVEKAGELLIGPVRRMVKQLAFEEPANLVRIVPSRLGEDAVALGAASLVIRQIFSEM